MPNEKVMKFKKGHNTLYTAINELVNSGKYYLDGDLGTNADGKLLSEYIDEVEITAYFCQSFADVISAKYMNCVQSSTTLGGQVIFNCLEATGWEDCAMRAIDKEVSANETKKAKEKIDNKCKVQVFKKNITAKQFITPDNIWYFDPAPAVSFGGRYKLNGINSVRIFSPPSEKPTFHDNFGMDIAYKTFCMDIDGVPENATADDCINECPFGYGIRADGKILNGARVDEWLEKTIQEKD